MPLQLRQEESEESIMRSITGELHLKPPVESYFRCHSSIGRPLRTTEAITCNAVETHLLLCSNSKDAPVPPAYAHTARKSDVRID